MIGLAPIHYGSADEGTCDITEVGLDKCLTEAQWFGGQLSTASQEEQKYSGGVE